MKRLLPLLVSVTLTSLPPVTFAQQASAPALSPEAAKAAEKMKSAFPEKPPLTRGFRARGAPASQTRSGSVIRSRGPVPTLLPAAAAAIADSQGALPAQPPVAPPPSIPSSQVDLVSTNSAEARVDPAQRIDFSDILFNLDSATVSPASQEVLQGIAHTLKSMPDRRFLVEGHTCDLGDASDPAHNVRLSCLRAEAVCAWLVHYGAAPGQVQPMGFGSKEPVQRPDPALSQAANEPLRAQNRRAAFRLLMK
ncbi:MAG TPA: OmpA family protein [Prosthecobacter sp.]